MCFLRACALCFLTLVVPGTAFADLDTTVPKRGVVRTVTEACRPAAVAAPKGVLGISDPHAADAAVVNLIAQTGVKWVRAEFHWSKIEPMAGEGYRWDAYDRMVQAYQQRGIRVLGILTYIPDTQPRDWALIDVAYRRFATAVVKRYAVRGVHHWEVFNEPNLPGYGWLTRSQNVKANLSAYTLLLARTNQAVRRNDPKGIVVLGGLASDQKRGITAEQTMQVIYDLGGKNCFDVMAFHPYGYQNRFPEARARVEAILAAGKDGGKPIWFNEYGWTEQAEMDIKINPDSGSNPMLAALKQRTSADALFWFAAKDYSAKLGTPEFGLATFDLRKRPSFETFRHFVTSIR